MYFMYVNGLTNEYHMPNLADAIKVAVDLYKVTHFTVDIVSTWTGEVVFSIGDKETHVSNDVKYAP